MRVELLCTGDELVTGRTVDTNSPWCEARLLAQGARVSRVTLVGDVREHITRALAEAAARADFVLVSGGLGPTLDDLTAEAAADALGVPLVEDAATLERLRARAAERGVALSPNNARQARVPRGAQVVQNPAGSAPLFAARLGACDLCFVPGVPREYRALVEAEVVPRLQRLLEARGPRPHYASRALRTLGLPESQLDARVAPLVPRHPHVTFGTRTDAPENLLVLTAQGPTAGDAARALAAAEADCLRALGDLAYGRDDEDLPRTLARALTAGGHTLALAESCTGGLIASLLTGVSGASAFFLGGAVAYSEPMKQAWAGVPADVLARHGAVSRETAGALARGVRAACGATFGLSVTGYAGPTGGTPEDPVGTVYAGLAGPAGLLHVARFHFPGDRERVRRAAALHTLDLLRRHLAGLALPTP